MVAVQLTKLLFSFSNHARRSLGVDQRPEPGSSPDTEVSQGSALARSAMMWYLTTSASAQRRQDSLVAPKNGYALGTEHSHTVPPSGTWFSFLICPSAPPRMFGFVKTLNSHHTKSPNQTRVIGGATTVTENRRNEQKAEVWTCFIRTPTGSCPRTPGLKLGG